MRYFCRKNCYDSFVSNNGSTIENIFTIQVCPSRWLLAMNLLIDMLLPGSRALKIWKTCRNQVVSGHTQACRRHCAVVYLLCLGHLRFAAVATRHPGSYSKQRDPALHFPGIFQHEMAEVKAKQHCCPCETVPWLVPMLLLLQQVTRKVYILIYGNLQSFHQLKKQEHWHTEVSYKSGLSCGQRYWISVAKTPSVL